MGSGASTGQEAELRDEPKINTVDLPIPTKAVVYQAEPYVNNTNITTTNVKKRSTKTISTAVINSHVNSNSNSSESPKLNLTTSGNNKLSPRQTQAEQKISDQSKKNGSSIVNNVQKDSPSRPRKDGSTNQNITPRTTTPRRNNFNKSGPVSTGNLPSTQIQPRHNNISNSAIPTNLVTDYSRTNFSMSSPNGPIVMNTPHSGINNNRQQFFAPPQQNIPQIYGTQTIPQNVQYITPPPKISNKQGTVPIYTVAAVSASSLSVPPTNLSIVKPNVNLANTTSTTPSHISSYTVKETNAVKRNRASIPLQLTHAQPKTGDWLNKRYIVNNYILLDILGEGSYAEVRLCKERTSDSLFAMKIISKEMLSKKKGGGNNSETFFDDIRREIAIMKKLLHPNVLRLFEVLDDPKVNKLYLVLEYMKRGDLFKVLQERVKLSNELEENPNGKSQTPYFTELELWNIFRQVSAGLRYLHIQNVIHGDIKPQNLLLSDNGIVKIADFGISRILVSNTEEDGDDVATGGGNSCYY